MASVRIKIVRIDYEAFPFWAEFELVGESGEIFVFQEKLPVLGIDASIASQPILPMNGEMECRIVSETAKAAVIDTSIPHGIEDLHGQTRFRVVSKALLDRGRSDNLN